MSNYPYNNIDWLRSNHKMIHFFGLGFIQLKLNDHLRMHFYTTTKYNPIISDEEIHDHRYDFSSKILKGRLNMEVYNVGLPPFDDIISAIYTMSKESCSRDPEILTSSISVDVLPELVRKSSYYSGQTYFLEYQELHRVWTDEPTITLLLRSEYKQGFANVIRFKEKKPVCPFSLKVPEAECWEILEEMIKDL